MKKNLLLIALFVASATSTFAQTNLVVNGDFEDVKNLKFDEYAPEDGMSRVLEIPGWDKNTGDKNATDCTNGFDGLNKWNVAANIIEQEPDGDMIKEGNTHFLHLERYPYNGWATGELKQTIKGLVVGHKYKFSMLYRFNLGEFNGDAPMAGFEVVAFEDNKEGKKIKYEENLEETTNWTAVSEEFTASTDGVVVKVSLTNPWREGQWNSHVWADFDEVSLVDLDSATGINNISTSTVDKDSYYTLDGVKVAQPTKKGVYVHNGKKIVK